MLNGISINGVESLKENPVREIPKNDHDALLQLWHALIGTNGSGLVTKFEDLEDSLKEKLPNLVTIDKCNGVQESKKSTAEKVFRWIKDVALVAIAAIALYKGVA